MKGLFFFIGLFIVMMIAEKMSFQISDAKIVDRWLFGNAFLPLLLVWIVVSFFIYKKYLISRETKNQAKWYRRGLSILLIASMAAAMSCMMARSFIVLSNAYACETELVRISGKVVSNSEDYHRSIFGTDVTYYLTISDMSLNRKVELEVPESDYRKIGDDYQHDVLIGRWGLLFTWK